MASVAMQTDGHVSVVDFSVDTFDDPPQDGYQGVCAQAPLKRGPSEDLPKPRAKKRKTESDEPLSIVAKFLRAYAPEKNPISILNEMQLSAAFSEATSEGPTHLANFRIRLELDGVVYEGEGRSKKQAKECAARKAVDALLSLSKSETAEATCPASSSASEDAVGVIKSETKDNLEEPVEEATLQPAQKDSPELPQYESAKNTLLYRAPAVPTNPLTVARLSELLSSLNDEKLSALEQLLGEAKSPKSMTNPIGLVLRIADALKFPHEFVDWDPHQPFESDQDSVFRQRKRSSSFVVKLNFFEEAFFARSHSKKVAKQMVACEALNWLVDVLPAVWRRITTRSIEPHDLQVESATIQDPRHLASEIYSAVIQILSDISLKHAGTVWSNYIHPPTMAAVCMSADRKMTPVALATGSSIIYRKHLNPRGRNIKDCQAEILVLRAVKKILLDQIAAYYKNEETIFSGPGENGLLVLKPGIGFHLFLSRYPSGSCTLLAKNEPAVTDKKLHYIDGEIVSGNVHTVPEDVGLHSFWDITDGHEKLRIMSASDKLMKKLVVGIQGALASCFCRAIFLQTVSVAEDMDLPIMAEGLYGRLQSTFPNDTAASSKCPEIIHCPPVKERFSLKDTIPLKGFVWHTDSESSGGREIFLETTMGQPAAGTTAEISKGNAGASFMKVVALMKDKGVTPPAGFQSNEHSVIYGLAKSSSESYREIVCGFRKTVQDAGLGAWIPHCDEEEAFGLDLQGAI
ncbi:double-stranded RNA-specific editase B2-like isoform X2 [Paramacrobiotus metropolitanus]|uniref:double-stranded RNA-specific editase B2-like isoform X2 n=1 Tax=Paramacrobiotus metropolitanus TaxID=2943436 RepID=UPI002445A7E5|nr:double-stranded RNA-specific editase B2-like isoform X2 [Paramacrobiotus metropolitanus]